MGLFDSFVKSAQGLARRSLGISPTDDDWYSPFGEKTKSGKKVSKKTALKLAVVYACIRILSEAVSVLPLHLYRKSSSGRERLDKHPAMRLLNSPHPQVTAMRWREAMQGHLLSHGNGSSYVVRTKGGGYDRLILLNPGRLSVKPDGSDGYKYSYRSTKDNVDMPLETKNVLHISGLGFDGRIGYSPITMAKEAIGLGLACEDFAGLFFSNGTHPGAVVEHPKTLSPDAHARLKRSIQEKHEGLGRSHKIMLLEEGMVFKNPGIPFKDSQFLEQRKFTNSEIAAKIYLVPPHMVGELDNATFSNIEEQELAFYKRTLMAWLVRWQQDLGLFFLTAEERESLYFEFDTAALLRGDTRSRFEAYSIGRNGGWLNADEIRAKENMPPLPNGTGQTYLIPLNMVPADQVASREGAGSATSQRSLIVLDGQSIGRVLLDSVNSSSRADTSLLLAEGERVVLPAESRSLALKNRLRTRYGGMFLNAADKIVQREARAIERAVGKHLEQRSKEDFNLWLDEFYDDLPTHILREFRALYASYGEAVFEAVSDGAEMPAEIEAFISAYQAGFAARYVSSSKGQLRALLRDIEPGLLAAAILERSKEWSDTRAAKVADDEIVRASGAVTLETYRAAGFKKKVWVRQGSKSCPYCTELDGKVVGLDEPFRDEGDFQPEGAAEPLAVAGPTFHAPLHQGCICDIQAR